MQTGPSRSRWGWGIPLLTIALTGNMTCAFLLQLMAVQDDEMLEHLECKDVIFDLMEQSGCDVSLKVKIIV